MMVGLFIIYTCNGEKVTQTGTDEPAINRSFVPGSNKQAAQLTALFKQ